MKEGCPESYAHSPYLSMSQEYYDNFELVKKRVEWIRKGAVQSRYPCFGDRRLCNKFIVYPQIRPFETASEGVNLWNPQRQYSGIWGVTEERKRLITRRNEQIPQTQLCTNITALKEIDINITLINGSNAFYNVSSPDTSKKWMIIQKLINTTILYCQQQEICFNQTVLKNTTVNGTLVLKKSIELKCQKILDESTCPGQMKNVTIVQNISYANATTWQLMNVTVSKCVMDEKSSASSQSNQNNPNSGTNNGGGSSGSGSSYGSTNNGGGSSSSGSGYGMRI